MSADKRSVATDALETLGTIISENEKRDAIHLAVEPVIAAHNMEPGAHVGLMADGRASELAPKHVGIVDPFLTDDVCAGDRFWLVVYPRQITSLRHVWTHPSFPDAETTAATLDGIKSESEQWCARGPKSIWVTTTTAIATRVPMTTPTSPRFTRDTTTMLAPTRTLAITLTTSGGTTGKPSPAKRATGIRISPALADFSTKRRPLLSN